MAPVHSFLFFFAALTVPFVEALPAPPLLTKCPIIKDGRIPSNFALQDFDTSASPFDPKYSIGQNLSWSQITRFPQPLTRSRFDAVSSHNTTKPVEVTITDASVFLPGGGSPQVGFRRAGFLLGNGSDATNVGVKTFHWSVRQPQPLFSPNFTAMNLSHEYMNAWHERNDYSGNQFSINAGVMLSQDYPANCSSECVAKEQALPRQAWKFLDHLNDIVFVTPIQYGSWQNFAVTLDYNANTLQIYYSVGDAALEAVTRALPNDNSGGGQFQIGILKKPTNTTSVVYDGYQESGIHEGQIYGGVFVEDSSNGCLSR